MYRSTVAPPVVTFLSSYDYTGKVIFPFCTHGGGGIGRIQNEIARLCPQARVMKILGIYGSGSTHMEKEILDWINDN